MASRKAAQSTSVAIGSLNTAELSKVDILNVLSIPHDKLAIEFDAASSFGGRVGMRRGGILSVVNTMIKEKDATIKEANVKALGAATFDAFCNAHNIARSDAILLRQCYDNPVVRDNYERMRTTDARAIMAAVNFAHKKQACDDPNVLATTQKLVNLATNQKYEELGAQVALIHPTKAPARIIDPTVTIPDFNAMDVKQLRAFKSATTKLLIAARAEVNRLTGLLKSTDDEIAAATAPKDKPAGSTEKPADSREDLPNNVSNTPRAPQPS